jgi:dTDP-4-dehydrorhamnose 3,5-epimerase
MSSRLSVAATPLAGVFVIERHALADDRGSFERLFCVAELAEAGIEFELRQANRTLTRREGTVRGLHFQLPPMAEKKLITCVAGTVFDVAVDLRAGSPSYGQHHAVELSGHGNRSFLIPEGCAHGFQTLSADCQMLYFHSRDYSARHEGGINAEDESLGISWPLPIAVMSARDAALPGIDAAFKGIES